jgi:hypothetical protein
VYSQTKFICLWKGKYLQYSVTHLLCSNLHVVVDGEKNSAGFVAAETPGPHEVQMECLHSFQCSGNHSAFTLPQWGTVYFSRLKYIVSSFPVLNVQVLFNFNCSNTYSCRNNE